MPTSTLLLKTKISAPPSRPHVIARARLLDQLREGLNRPLTLVAAQAGFGKTTLVTSWLDEVKDLAKVAWLSLDQEDNDPMRFLYYLVATLQTVEPVVGRAPISLLSRLGLPRPKDLADALLNEIAETRERIILVLDDYHTVKDPEIHATMAHFIERVPEQLHVVIVTREEPPFPLARWRALQRVVEIGPDELRFSPDESSEFLEQTMGLKLDADLARTLEARTEGWIAGLQMAALSVQKHARAASADIAEKILRFNGEHHYVIEYLAGEVLRQQPAEIRSFLQKTAILDRLSAPLCDAVSGQTDSKAILTRLEQANMFLLRLDDNREWFRYHQLFRDFLRTELDATMERDLHRRASAWHETHGSGKDAIRHALAAKDIPATIRLFRSQVESMLARGEIQALLSWLNTIPESKIRAHSDLAGYKAWLLYLLGRTAEAHSYSPAVRAIDATESNPARRGMMLVFKAFLAVHWGDPADVKRFAQQALDELGESASFFRAYALSFLGQSQIQSGERSEAVKTLRQAVELAEKLQNHFVMLDALGHLASVMTAQGQLREAHLLCLNAVEKYVDARGEPDPVAGLVYVPLGTLYYEMNDLESARHYLTRGVVLCQQLGMIYYTLMGQRALAKLQNVCDEAEASWHTLASARDVAERSESQMRRRLVAVVTAELQLREGNTSAAARTLGDMQKPPSSVTEYESLTYTRLLLAQHRPSKAEEVLNLLERAAAKEKSEGSLIAIHVLQALCQRALGHPSATVERLEKAVSLAASAGYRRVFLDEGPVLTPLLEKVRHVAPTYVSSLIDRDSAEQRAAPQALPEPLSRTEREILRLITRGLTNQEIADILGTTLGTTKWHLNQIFGKLQVHNRTTAIAKARDLRLL
jgi:LuxR family maltose regulon positive regulatory protein